MHHQQPPDARWAPGQERPGNPGNSRVAGEAYPKGIAHPAASLRRPLRHPAELPLVVLAVIVTVIGLLSAFLTIQESEAVPTQVAVLIFGAPLVFWIARGRILADARVNSVRITPAQFPQAYAMVAEAAARFGLDTVPDAYVTNGNGVLNAFAAGHGRRRFVVLNSDLFEVGGRLRDPDTLRFIIGHEVGHIAAGHASYWRQIGTNLFNTVPIAGATLSRAQEYTADNHGYLFAPEGHRGMTVLAAGKYVYPAVDFDAMADRSRTERGFFVWLVNATASHPVMVKRFAALRDRSRAGKLF